MIDMKEVIEIIKKSECPWNPLQTPEWHLHQWKTSVILDLQKVKNEKDRTT